MQTLPQPSIGFDRFVALAWLDKALEVACSGGEYGDLRTWIDSRVQGEAASKKTSSVLSMIWLQSNPATNHLRYQALSILPDLSTDERLVLHWGMALATYPFFRTTASAMGRLLKLQGEFQINDIRTRVLEQHGNIGTVPRAVSRIVQSVKDWGAIDFIDGHYKPTPIHHIKNSALLEWLLHACMSTSQRDHWGVTDLLQATELFPFDVGKIGHFVLHDSDRFVILYEGLDREIVLLAE